MEVVNGVMVMRIEKINFGAKIRNTDAHKYLKELFARDSERFPTLYDDFCKSINEILPKETDVVDFRGVNNDIGQMKYFVAGRIVKDGRKSSFCTEASYENGANEAANTIVNLIKGITELMKKY